MGGLPLASLGSCTVGVEDAVGGGGGRGGGGEGGMISGIRLSGLDRERKRIKLVMGFQRSCGIKQ